VNLLISLSGLLFTLFQIYYLKNWLRKKRERYKSKTIGASDVTPLTQIVAVIILGLVVTVFFFLKFLDE
jgi:hypothetical protein